jgi:predicted nucleic-acid-binding Zn-ribbon protein
MKIDSCPKCGSAERTRGKIYEAGTLNDIRFKADEAFGLSLKERLVALACKKCGYIEFYLADHDSGESA